MAYIDRIIPSAGLPGTVVTIYFVENTPSWSAYSQVFFNGGAELLYQKVVPKEYIIGTIPPGAESGQLVLGGPFLNPQADVWFACQPPKIDSVTPDRILAGRSITIYGKSFGQPQGEGSVYIGDVQLLVRSWEMTKIVVTVPNYASSGDLMVLTPIGVSNKRGVVITGTSTSASIIASVSPSTCKYWDKITITGSGFKPYVAGSSYIMIGSDKVDLTSAAGLSWSDSNISFYLTNVGNIESGDIVIGTDEGESNPFYLNVKPIIPDTVSAMNAPPGAAVTVTATNMGAAKGKVYIGETSCVVTSWSKQLGRLTFTVPINAPEGNLRIANNNDFVDAGYFKASKSAGPYIEQLSPSSGPPASYVEILGGNMKAPITSVTVGGQACTEITGSDLKVRCRIPGDARSGNIEVTCSNGTAIGPIFSVLGPVIDLLVPTTDNYETKSEIPVLIKGQNFAFGPGIAHEVYYGALKLNVPEDAWAAGEVSVTLLKELHQTTDYFKVKIGSNFSNSKLFVIEGTQPPADDNPVLTALVPNSAVSGDIISLRGARLEQFGKLYVGSQEIAPISWTDSEISFTVPSNFTTSSVYVENSKGASNALILYADYTDPGTGGGTDDGAGGSTYSTSGPAFKFAPTAAFVGERITITGEGFGDYPGDVLLRGAVPMHVISWTDTEIIAEVPEDGETGNVSLATDDWTSRGSVLKVYQNSQDLIDEQFAIPTADKPHILSVYPQYGVPGDSITISGVNFGEVLGGVTVGGVSQDTYITAWSPTEIIFTVAPDTKTGNLIVTTLSGESNTVYFTLLAGHPLIESVAPSVGQVPNQIQITGQYFGAAKGVVLFGNTLYSEVLPGDITWTSTRVIVNLTSTIDYHSNFVQIVTADGIPSNEYPFSVEGVSTAPSTRLSYKDIRNYTGQLIAEASHILETLRALPAGSGTVDHLDVELIDGHKFEEFQTLLDTMLKEATNPMSLAFVKPNEAGNIKIKRRGYIDIRHDKAKHQIIISLKNGADKDNSFTTGFCEINGVCRVISSTIQRTDITVADLIKEVVGVLGVKTFTSDGADGKEVTMNLKFGTTEETAARGDHSHKESAPKYYVE